MKNEYEKEEVNDFVGFEEEIKILGKDYILELNYRQIAKLETLCKKGVFKIQELIFENNLPFDDYINLLYCGLQIHHDEKTAVAVSQLVQKNMGLLTPLINSLVDMFMKPLLSPVSLEEVAEGEFDEKNSKKKITP